MHFDQGMTPKRSAPPTGEVLVVDDDMAMRQSIEWLLEGNGFTVVTAADGGEALERLREGLEPCLILLDLTMRGMDGFEFRKMQMQDPKLAAIPLVICSAGGKPGPMRELRAAAYLEKPFQAESLLKLVEQYCLRS